MAWHQKKYLQDLDTQRFWQKRVLFTLGGAENSEDSAIVTQEDKQRLVKFQNLDLMLLWDFH